MNKEQFMEVLKKYGCNEEEAEELSTPVSFEKLLKDKSILDRYDKIFNIGGEFNERRS